MCSGLRLASFSTWTSDLYIRIILYTVGWFCFCSGLSLRGVVRRILQTVLPLTFTTGTRRCRCQRRFWNVYAGQMRVVTNVPNGLKEHSPLLGGEGADRLENPLPVQKWNCHLQSHGISPFLKSSVSMSAELSEKWPAFASDVCDPSRLQSQEHAASRAVYSCGMTAVMQSAMPYRCHL